MISMSVSINKSDYFVRTQFMMWICQLTSHCIFLFSFSLRFAAYGATKRSVVHLTKSLQVHTQLAFQGSSVECYSITKNISEQCFLSHCIASNILAFLLIFLYQLLGVVYESYDVNSHFYYLLLVLYQMSNYWYFKNRVVRKIIIYFTILIVLFK